METVFDHNPTQVEIEKLGFLDNLLSIRHGLEFPDPLTETGYRETISAEGALFDLGLLFTYRGDEAKSNSYYIQIPIMVEEYKLGFDYVAIPDNSASQELG